MLRSGVTAFRVTASRTASPAASLRVRIPAAFPGMMAPQSTRYFREANSSFLRAMQVHGFSSITGTKDDKEQQLLQQQQVPQTIEELLAENEALRKEVATLKEQVNKKPGKFMALISQFGMPFLIWWTGMYFATGVGIYAALDSGLIAGKDIIDFVMSLGLDKYIDVERLNPTYGNIALAILVNECLEPLRFPIAVATIPYVKRVFSRKKAPETQ